MKKLIFPHCDDIDSELLQENTKILIMFCSDQKQLQL